MYEMYVLINFCFSFVYLSFITGAPAENLEEGEKEKIAFLPYES